MIHIFNEDNDWEVWSDTEISEMDGRCIGSGKTKAEALEDARVELVEELERIHALLECESQHSKNNSPSSR